MGEPQLEIEALLARRGEVEARLGGVDLLKGRDAVEMGALRLALLKEAVAAIDGGRQIDIAARNKLVTALNALDDYIIENDKVSHADGRVLRDLQYEVFKEIRSFWEKGYLDGYCVLPTGYGKTVM